jgi:hypothetical protein
MAIKIPKKRGRPSKVELAAREKKVKQRSPELVLKSLKRRFEILNMLGEGAAKGDIVASVVTGAPGIGKSFNSIQTLKRMGAKHTVVGGGISGPGLFTLAWENRKKGEVIVIDDGDGVFEDQDTLNLLKGMCDSSSERLVSWYKEAQWMKEAGIDRQFVYHGSIIFISNLDFQGIVDSASVNRKFKAHFEALMSRSLYLDLQLHTRRDIIIWIKYLCTEGKLFAKHDISPVLGARILKFLDKYHEDMREISLRTLTVKLFPLAKTKPDAWEEIAEELLLKPGA